mmetsp:Transcript_20730/g.18139  ORF Transcript_20730/g.18139 Transcript_20730/m.18139 type:complete len:95 (-) Transcript_20730:415-699(-)
MDFHNLGKHCHEPTCRQIDFLPFQCSHCKLTFCLDHRDARSHECKFDVKVYKCPDCLMVVKYDEGTTTEAEVAKRHRRIDCQAGDKAKVDARRS